MNRYITVITIAITAFIFTISAWGQTVSVVTLTNGPPNIPYGAPGSCTYSNCTWIQAGLPAGSPVTDVFADMLPMSANYANPFSLSGPSASNFSISTTNDGTRNVGHITTNGVLGAGDYDITVNAGSASQRITVHAASGITVGCGTDTTIQNAVNANPGTNVFLLANNCTYNFAGTVNANANQLFLGAGIGKTTITGGGQGGNTPGFFYGNGAGPPGNTGVGIGNLTFNNFNGVKIQATDFWVVRNNYFTGGSGRALMFQGNNGLLFANNTCDTLGGSCVYAGVGWSGDGAPSASTPNMFIGNHMFANNQQLDDSCNDSGGGFAKGTGNSAVPGVYEIVQNNYIHDNLGWGDWFDFSGDQVVTITQNTILSNGTSGISDEIASGVNHHDISFNVLRHNSLGYTNPSNSCFHFWGQLFNDESANVAMHDNNITADPVLSGNPYNVTAPQIAIDLDSNGRQNGPGSTDTVANTTISSNTVNLIGAGCCDSALSFSVAGGTNTSGSSASGNHYHFTGGDQGTAQYFMWHDNTKSTLAQFCSVNGQDCPASGTTVDSTAVIASGCTHVACSGSGVGAGGVPLAAASNPSIQSLALSNSTFTPNVANGVVGTVSATMSDGSAFSGKLSITGTNSGGFHLSGNTLEEKASGTPAGIYNDFNLVATQSTASNSPQQISPTVTGVVDAPFGGTARSITNRIQAEDFDVGGYGVAYHATDACTLGIDTAYGPDRLNVNPTADLDSENNLKIGCNQAGDWHNYTITVPTTGTYTLNMRVANIQAGAAYHVAVDGASVVSGIAVPNTGAYDTFATVTSNRFGLTAGQHILQLVLDAVGPSGFGGDFNWMQGTLVKAGAIGSKNIDITVTH